MASHFQKNTEDIRFKVFGFELLMPQRFWTSFYFRSLRTFYLLGEELEEAYGELNINKVTGILRKPDLIDQRDSMNAAVYQPELLKVYFAMGQVPATSGPFIPFDLTAYVGKENPP